MAFITYLYANVHFQRYVLQKLYKRVGRPVSSHLFSIQLLLNHKLAQYKNHTLSQNIMHSTTKVSATIHH